MNTYNCYDNRKRLLGEVKATNIGMAELIAAGKWSNFAFALEI